MESVCVCQIKNVKSLVYGFSFAFLIFENSSYICIKIVFYFLTRYIYCINFLKTLQDSFIIKMYKPDSSPLCCVHELTLKLARKCLDVFGSGIFEDENNYHTISE